MNRGFIFLLFVVSFSCRESLEVTTPLQRAAHYLWSRQAPDGGWHSPVHGIMKGGEAHTPFVLFALMQIPEDIYPLPSRKKQKALSFIRSHLNEKGVIGLSRPEIPEYPNYATAYALRVLIQNRDAADSIRIKKMQLYLAEQQFTENRGITQNHLAYGSWGFGEPDIRTGSTGHLDISHTRKVLQALRSSGYEDSSAYVQALRFLAVLQKRTSLQPDPLRYNAQLPEDGKPVISDGGFYISPIVYSANKGGIMEETEQTAVCFRSYATATCDGILALLACGVKSEDPSIQIARKWLEIHPELSHDTLPDDPTQWQAATIIYHLWVRSEVYKALLWQGNWREEIEQELLAYQRADGSYANRAGSRNKEDDPLLATAMAVLILN
ncbi:MAG: prenyltransferase/squalene oxidase repeat-containing protein [Bacteroidia bacterium]|nr:prenyltransferase/squalene oxidase repeat-containing protein [Bacteroidia bacterium]